MYGFLGWIDVVAENLVMVFLLEGNLVVDWVIGNLYDISCSVLERLILAIELHFVAIPRIPIGTDEVVTMIGISVTEIEVYSLHAV